MNFHAFRGPVSQSLAPQTPGRSKDFIVDQHDRNPAVISQEVIRFNR